jgi:hypothetical protein
LVSTNGKKAHTSTALAKTISILDQTLCQYIYTGRVKRSVHMATPPWDGIKKSSEHLSLVSTQTTIKATFKKDKILLLPDRKYPQL